MKILQSWLKEYISFSLRPEAIADRLGKLGLEVVSVERPGEKYRGFVVGHVRECSKHPKADRLSVCQVDTGKEQLQIVCGAPNVEPGQKVAVGLVGATIPRNQHDAAGHSFVLSRVILRGVESAGMICSEYELGLGSDADGILVLDPSARTGEALGSFLGLDDVVYDVEITPNRPDWLSHLGVAREIGVALKRSAKRPAVRLREGKTPIRKFLSIRVEDRVNCPRFAARMIRGVKIAPSPKWLQDRMRAVGLRPINNVVDATNHVMYECGHPLHAFDYALLEGGTIVVRQCAPGTRFRTLDGKDHQLREGTVMVCDASREVSIAGIMGGENSEIRDTTVDVVLEAAYWNPSSIRRTAKGLGISTDASQRFERGADPNGVDYALDRVAALVLELSGGELLKGKIDIYPKKVRPHTIHLRHERTNAVLGTTLKISEIARALASLGIACRRVAGGLACTVPTYRVDLLREIDLIEEVARVWGYDSIEPRRRATITLEQPFPSSGSSDRVRDALLGDGFTEALASSMQDEFSARLSGAEPARILNPLGQEMAFLRTSLLPGLLDALKRNQHYGTFDLRIFEIGHVFRIDSGASGRLVEDYLEEERVAMLLSGEARPRQWAVPARKADIFDLKGAVAKLLENLSLDKTRFISYSTSDGLTEGTLSIEIHGSYAGSLGKVREDLLRHYGIEGEAYVAEILLSQLVMGKSRKYKELPRFPRVRRDISLFVDHAVPVGEVEEEIWKAGGELLSAVDLFDVYSGDRAPAGKKSLAYSLELLSREKTMTDAEIETAVRRVVSALEKRFGATLRSEH